MCPYVSFKFIMGLTHLKSYKEGPNKGINLHGKKVKPKLISQNILRAVIYLYIVEIMSKLLGSFMNKSGI